MQENEKELINGILKKKALGYTATDISEEYSVVDGGLTLTKKKVSKKEVPPELSAIKLLMENSKEDTEFTEEELLKEKQRLLCELKNIAKTQKSKIKPGGKNGTIKNQV